MATVSVEQSVKGVISQVLAIPVAAIDDKAHLEDDLGADSLHRIEIQMALEEQFGIQIPDEEVDELLVVGNAIQWIEDHLA